MTRLVRSIMSNTAPHSSVTSATTTAAFTYAGHLLERCGTRGGRTVCAPGSPLIT